MFGIILLILLIAGLLIWIISVQNKLVSVSEFCENSLSQIGMR